MRISINRTQSCRFYVCYISRFFLHLWNYPLQIRTSVAKIDETSWDTEPVPFQLDQLEELEASTSGQSSQRAKKMWKAASFGSQSSGTDVDLFEIDWDICFICQITVCVCHKKSFAMNTSYFKNSSHKFIRALLPNQSLVLDQMTNRAILLHASRRILAISQSLSWRYSSSSLSLSVINASCNFTFNLHIMEIVTSLHWWSLHSLFVVFYTK